MFVHILFGHIIGDYWLQPPKMAVGKGSRGLHGLLLCLMESAKCIINHPDLTPELSPEAAARKIHDLWIELKSKQGYTQGDSKDDRKLTSTCFVLFDEEIEYEKLDDYLRTLTVRGLSEEEFNLLFNVFDSWRNDREKKSLDFGKVAWIER